MHAYSAKLLTFQTEPVVNSWCREACWQFVSVIRLQCYRLLFMLKREPQALYTIMQLWCCSWISVKTQTSYGRCIYNRCIWCQPYIVTTKHLARFRFVVSFPGTLGLNSDHDAFDLCNLYLKVRVVLALYRFDSFPFLMQLLSLLSAWTYFYLTTPI